MAWELLGAEQRVPPPFGLPETTPEAPATMQPRKQAGPWRWDPAPTGGPPAAGAGFSAEEAVFSAPCAHTAARSGRGAQAGTPQHVGAAWAHGSGLWDLHVPSGAPGLPAVPLPPLGLCECGTAVTGRVARARPCCPPDPSAGHCWRPRHLGQWPALHRVAVAAPEGTNRVGAKVDQTLLRGGREIGNGICPFVCPSLVGSRGAGLGHSWLLARTVND